MILYLSRLHPMKACDLLISAFANSCASHLDLRLVIAGPADESFRSALQKLAAQCAVEDQITWTGPLSTEMKWAALRSASLFALPSHCEAFPLALLEALGVGVPALITDKVNIWNCVTESHCGFVDTDTVEGTVRSLEKWLALSSVELQAMRANALKCFSERFEATSNASRFIAGLKRHGVGG